MLALRKLAPEPGIALTAAAEAPLAPGEVRIAVRATGICGTDLHIADWHAGYEAMASAMPVTLGHEICGHVVEGRGLPIGMPVVVRPSATCGPACRSCVEPEEHCQRRVGIGIARDGGFAARMIAPLRNCVPVPPGLPPELAALCEPLTVAHEAARNAAAGAGQDVLVIGPGPIGLGAALFLRAGHGRVTIAGRDDAARLAAARALGFQQTLDTRGRPLIDALKAEKLPTAFDAIVEATGSASVTAESQAVLKPRGRLVVAGIHGRPAALDLTRLVRLQQAVIGSYRAPVSAWREVLAWIDTHREEAGGLVSHRLPLSRIMEGFALMRRREAVKVIVSPDQG